MVINNPYLIAKNGISNSGNTYDHGLKCTGQILGGKQWQQKYISTVEVNSIGPANRK